ncbi:MAG: hypothetical protein ACK4LQ_02100 [Pararhodobacter sp.]
MSVVNQKSNLFADRLLDEVVPDPARARGRPIVIAGRAENAADDSEGSKYLLFEAPSDCIVDPRTAFQVENTGFAAIRIGTRTDPEALVSQLKSAENVATPVAQFDANHGLPLWQVLGLEADPGGNIGIYQHAIANATGAGHLLFEIHYRYR